MFLLEVTVRVIDTMMSLGPELFSLSDSIETYWAGAENPKGLKGAGGMTHKGRKGRPSIPIKRGERVVLVEASGRSGIVRRIWLTLDHPHSPEVLRGMRVEMTWDGASRPAVSAPLADFFGQGLGRSYAFESVFFSNPEGRSFNTVLPMPFQSGFRIEVINESKIDIEWFFYDVDYTLGDKIGSPSYLHAYWHRENPTKLGIDFEVLPKVAGRGRYLGANFSVIVDNKTYASAWWGEGECKVFLDGDGEHPTLVGTGVEDYIGTAWGQGKFANLYQGCPVAEPEAGLYAFYRYHVPDPIYFQRDIRVTFQQIGGAFPEFILKMRDIGTKLIEAGAGDGAPLDMNMVGKPSALFERQDDWSSCCFFYLDRPENDLPALAPVEERIRGLEGRNS